jgi:hypothetical protein
LKAYTFLFGTEAPEEIWGKSDQKFEDDQEQFVLINLHRVVVMNYFEDNKPDFIKNLENYETPDYDLTTAEEATRGGFSSKEPCIVTILKELKEPDIILYGGPLLMKNPFDEYFLFHTKF